MESLTISEVEERLQPELDKQKRYSDQKLDKYAGGTLHAPLILHANASQSLQAVPKQQLDSGLAPKANTTDVNNALAGKANVSHGHSHFHYFSWGYYWGPMDSGGYVYNLAWYPQSGSTGYAL